MIDFRATYDKDGLIHFCNSHNESLKTYPMSELKYYVDFNELNKDILGEFEHATTYIDREWFEVCEKFYMDQNPIEYQSANRIQETRKALR